MVDYEVVQLFFLFAISVEFEKRDAVVVFVSLAGVAPIVLIDENVVEPYFQIVANPFFYVVVFVFAMAASAAVNFFFIGYFQLYV